MQTQVDILENEIKAKYPEVLELLLFDHTSRKNIIWATNNYKNLGEQFRFDNEISQELITGENGHIIMPRVHKDKILQKSRTKDKAEIFTPSWVCNAQNNLIDNVWFGRENIFNFENKKPNENNRWKVNKSKIEFPDGKSWENYVKDRRLEITCGEAPYITSRYDTTNGEFIQVEDRIGLLDRKLRVINENVDESGEWLKASQIAYKSIYAYEWQGDSLLLARESMLVTFIENYRLKFGEEPLLKSIRYIAYIISWNVWQMDGLKGVIPNSCEIKEIEEETLYGTNKVVTPCKGCSEQKIKKHNGIYCLIKDWRKKDPETGRMGLKLRFIDLIGNSRL